MTDTLDDRIYESLKRINTQRDEETEEKILQAQRQVTIKENTINELKERIKEKNEKEIHKEVAKETSRIISDYVSREKSFNEEIKQLKEDNKKLKVEARSELKRTLRVRTEIDKIVEKNELELEKKLGDFRYDNNAHFDLSEEELGKSFEIYKTYLDRLYLEFDKKIKLEKTDEDKLTFFEESKFELSKYYDKINNEFNRRDKSSNYKMKFHKSWITDTIDLSLKKLALNNPFISKPEFKVDKSLFRTKNELEILMEKQFLDFEAKLFDVKKDHSSYNAEAFSLIIDKYVNSMEIMFPKIASFITSGDGDIDYTLIEEAKFNFAKINDMFKSECSKIEKRYANSLEIENSKNKLETKYANLLSQFDQLSPKTTQPAFNKQNNKLREKTKIEVLYELKLNSFETNLFNEKTSFNNYDDKEFTKIANSYSNFINDLISDFKKQIISEECDDKYTFIQESKSQLQNVRTMFLLEHEKISNYSDYKYGIRLAKLKIENKLDLELSKLDSLNDMTTKPEFKVSNNYRKKNDTEKLLDKVNLDLKQNLMSTIDKFTTYSDTYLSADNFKSITSIYSGFLDSLKSTVSKAVKENKTIHLDEINTKLKTYESDIRMEYRKTIPDETERDMNLLSRKIRLTQLELEDMVEE